MTSTGLAPWTDTIAAGRALQTLVRHLLAVAALCAAFLPLRGAQAAVYSEDAVKAAFLHRFASYVEWPPPASQARPFTIGVLEADGVLTELEALLPRLTLQNGGAEVRKISTVQELEGVHILFVGAKRLNRAKPLIAAASGRPILVVSDEPGGLERGAMINFVPVGRNVRLEISLPAAEHNGLRINSGLLSVAVRVVRGAQENSSRSQNAPEDARLAASTGRTAVKGGRLAVIDRRTVRT
jgi:hypothetical protein